jgi:hypothetical protein
LSHRYFLNNLLNETEIDKKTDYNGNGRYIVMGDTPQMDADDTYEFVGKIADEVEYLGLVWDLAKYLNNLVTDKKPDPLMASLNRIHVTLGGIKDDILASWVAAREENIAFILAHSSAALLTVNAFVKSGATRSSPEWAPRLALALRDSSVAVQTFTADIERGFWRRPESIKAISWSGDPTSFFQGWMPHISARAERDSFGNVWDYRWALPVALSTILVRIIVLRAAGEPKEAVKSEIDTFNNFLFKVVRKMESGIKSVGFLSADQVNDIPTKGVPIATADIYGGYYLGGIHSPQTLVSHEPKAREIPFPPGVIVPTDGSLDAIVRCQHLIQGNWSNIIKEKIGIGALFRFNGGLDNILKSMESENTELSELHDKGIDFSVSEKDLLDWLSNPDFTPYPAISEALLKVLGDSRLRKLVFLDVIVFKYEETPGVSSPRKLTDVDLNILRKSVVDSYNERYGENVTSFQSLLA